jgi:hypothetical protein
MSAGGDSYDPVCTLGMLPARGRWSRELADLEVVAVMTAAERVVTTRGVAQ